MSVVPTDAQSRIEQLLSDLLNGNTSDISPQSRNEAFLLGLINGVIPDIDPVSRVECYLKALCEKNAGSTGGGGSSSASPKDVNFYDYDGTIVASYSLSEAQSLTALPDGPTHSGLTFQGWNYTLDKIKAFTRPMNVGATYITDDGKTRLYIRIAAEGRMTVPLYISQTVANGVTIDWGDGSATQTLAGTGNVNTTHTYANIGDYVITLDLVDGCVLGFGDGSNSYCVLGSTETDGSVYRNMLQAVQIGTGVTSIGDRAFQACYSLASITIPDSVTSIGNRAFSTCYPLASIIIPDSVTSIGTRAFGGCSLISIIIPDGVTSIGNFAFSECYPLTSITIPDSVTSIGKSAFKACYSLASITIPDSVTSIGNSTFDGCSLTSIIIPDGVTSIGDHAFNACYPLTSITIPDSVTSIGNYTFSGCYSLASIAISGNVTSIGYSVFAECCSLASIVIPDGVTSIGASAFGGCYGMAEYHLKPTTPPTLSSTDAFANIPSDCIIYVPTGCLNAYQNATNWATYASYMQEEPA